MDKVSFTTLNYFKWTYDYFCAIHPTNKAKGFPWEYPHYSLELIKLTDYILEDKFNVTILKTLNIHMLLVVPDTRKPYTNVSS